MDALRKELEGEGVRGRGIDQDFKGSAVSMHLHFEVILVSFGDPWSPFVMFFCVLCYSVFCEAPFIDICLV